MKRIVITTFAAMLAVAFLSCVPASHFEDLEARYNQTVSENEELTERLEACEEENARMEEELITLSQRIDRLEEDTMQLRNALHDLEEAYDQYKTHAETLMEGKTEETRQILERLQETQEDLQRREDELQEAQREMEEKEQHLNTLMADVREKEGRVNELEEILHRQDSIVDALQQTVSNALLGFRDEGLSVEVRNGKVYISLEERLLFETGSAEVDADGERALSELAGVLAENPDINIMIEGHTDDVPFMPGARIKDNWELSVLRATAIVRILLKHGDIDPQRLIAAGRGEHHPVDPADSPEARQKNRRTEIILTPQLDELFEIIEQH